MALSGDSGVTVLPACARGDDEPASLKPILADHMVPLRRYARRLLGNSCDVDDLVQDCLARALSRAHLWRPGSDLRAWLFTILHNMHVNNLRARNAVSAVPVDDAIPAPPEQENRLALRDLARALARVPDEQRQVLLLVGLEGMSYAEAARVQGVPVGTVMSRLARGRCALRRECRHAA